MSQPDKSADPLFQKQAAEDTQRETLREEQQKLAEERRKFEREKREFYLKQEMEEKRLNEESRLFRLKWEILEGELRRLAKEKQDMAKEKERYYDKYNSYQEHSAVGEGSDAEMFFSGVDNELALKKRYKELIKIYHPDNLAGDTVTLQMINKTYDILKKRFTA